MPFLCVLFRRDVRTAPTGASASTVDQLRLQEMLCPYRGRIRRLPITMHGDSVGTLLVSQLAKVSRSGCEIPANTRKNASSAWLEVVVDPGRLTFRTDPLGTFPLWWFEDESRVVITSEVKSLTALPGVKVEFDGTALRDTRHPADFSPFRGIRRVHPGAALHVSPDLEVTEEQQPCLIYRPNSMFTTRSEAEAALGSALADSARAICDGQADAQTAWGAFLSGGVDSSLATALTQVHQPAVQTFTLGTDLGSEYSDGETLSAHLGLKHTRVAADAQTARAQFAHAVICNEMVDGLAAEILAQLGVLAKAASHCVRQIVTGYGSDLLFGSMLRHEQYMTAAGVDDLQSLIERTCWTREFSPFYAWSHGIEIHHLFWDPAVMNTAFRIPPEFNFDGTTEKMPLRSLAVERGHLDHRHAYRKKQAMTDGTRFDRLLSSALGIGDNHAYQEKSARCTFELNKILNPTALEHIAS
jgi:carbapenam-3-carboxylate synthase